MNISPEDAGFPPRESAGGVVYEVVYSDEHIMGLWRHTRLLKRRSRMFMRGFRVVAGMILAGLIGLVFMVAPWQQWYLAVAILGILSVLVFSEQIDGWLLRRRWRKGHHRNRRARLAFTAEGLHAQSDVSQSVSKWAAFTAAVRFPDGFLLFSGLFLPHWHRHADLVQGTPEDAAALLKTHVPVYEEK